MLLTVDAERVAQMRDAVFFDGLDASRRLSRFWILLILAAIIASAGVVADSTATVIGAMIVAPLMIPIQGTMLASVLGDRANLVRSVTLVIAAAAAAVAIGLLIAALVSQRGGPIDDRSGDVAPEQEPARHRPPSRAGGRSVDDIEPAAHPPTVA